MNKEDLIKSNTYIFDLDRVETGEDKNKIGVWDGEDYFDTDDNSHNIENCNNIREHNVKEQEMEYEYEKATSIEKGVKYYSKRNEYALLSFATQDLLEKGYLFTRKEKELSLDEKCRKKLKENDYFKYEGYIFHKHNIGIDWTDDSYFMKLDGEWYSNESFLNDFTPITESEFYGETK